MGDWQSMIVEQYMLPCPIKSISLFLDSYPHSLYYYNLVDLVCIIELLESNFTVAITSVYSKHG